MLSKYAVSHPPANSLSAVAQTICSVDPCGIGILAGCQIMPSPCDGEGFFMRCASG